MTFGARLKGWAKGRFGNLKNLARESGINYTQLSGYASDSVTPSLDVLQKLAARGANIHWLTTGLGDMDAPGLQVDDETTFYTAPSDRAQIIEDDAVQRIADRLVTELVPVVGERVVEYLRKEMVK